MRLILTMETRYRTMYHQRLHCDVYNVGGVDWINVVSIVMVTTSIQQIELGILNEKWCKGLIEVLH